MKYSLLNHNKVTSLKPAHAWRPRSLRIPYFTAFSVLCILLCIAIELVVRGCSEGGCRIFGAMSMKHISFGTNLAYNLVPTAISLVLGLIWSLPHYDIMRLEPYFQMSAKEGATAVNSLFLEYPYTFTPLVLYEGGKRRHYMVLLSTCILILINFLIIPATSGMFDNVLLKKLVPDTAARRGLYPENNRPSTTSDFAYMAYTYTWLNGSLPAFTTPTYALLPVVNPNILPVENETWSAETTLFEAELTCHKVATNISQNNGVPSFDIIAEDGSVLYNMCDAQNPFANCSAGTTFTTTWTSLARMIVDYPTGSPGNGTYIIGWAQGRHDDSTTTMGAPSNITALSCESSYYSEVVHATFSALSGEVLSFNRTGVRKPFLNPSGFLNATYNSYSANSTLYGLSVLPQYVDSYNNTVGLGYIPPYFPRPLLQIEKALGPPLEDLPDYTGYWGPLYIAPGDRLTPFVLSKLTRGIFRELLDPEVLRDRYEAAFKMLFAMWVAREVVDNGVAESVPVMRSVWARGFQVNRSWASIVQGGLVITAVMAMALGVMIGRRHCNLDQEPDSLAEKLRLLSGSADLCGMMRYSEFHQLEDVSGVLSKGDTRYALKLVPRKGPMIQVNDLAECKPLIAPVEGNSESPTTTTTPLYRVLGPPDQDDKGARGKQVWQLTTIAGLGFVLAVGIVLILLVATFICSNWYNGLLMIITANSFGYKMLFSFIPLILSRSLESILVTIGSCYSMFGPYRALAHKKAPASTSLVVDYSKFPPGFQLLHSLGTQNFALAGLGILIILSNVLSITFSGLFSPSLIEVPRKTEVQRPSVKINRGFSQPAQEMNYILSTHLVGDISVPTWTTEEYYIVPFYEDTSSVTRYEGTTLGIGVDIECELMSDDDIIRSCGYLPRTHGVPGNITKCINSRWDEGFYYVMPDDSCKAHLGYGRYPEYPIYHVKSSQLSWGWGWTPSSDQFVRSSSCPDTFFAIWAERPADPHPKNGSSPYQTKIDAVVLKCTSQDKFAQLTASVNQDERVTSISNVNPLDPQEIADLHPANRNATRSLSISFIDAIQAGIDEMMNYRAPTLMWFNHLMAAIDPSIIQNHTNITHIPNTSNLTQTFEDVYRRLFAINLRLQAKDVLSIGPLNNLTGIVAVQKERVKVDTPMFVISALILFITIVVLGAVYWCGPPQVPGHPPMSLAVMYIPLYASNAKEECGGFVGDHSEGMVARLGELDARYSYGSFKDQDGKGHVGVYRE